MPKAKDENKIEQIFKATLKLVSVEGFGGLRMSDVAKEAGMATGTLYIYFKAGSIFFSFFCAKEFNPMNKVIASRIYLISILILSNKYSG